MSYAFLLNAQVQQGDDFLPVEGQGLAHNTFGGLVAWFLELTEHQPWNTRVAGNKADMCEKHGFQGLVCLFVPVGYTEYLVRQLPRLPAGDGLPQAALVGEVLEQGALGHANFVCDAGSGERGRILLAAQMHHCLNGSGLALFGALVGPFCRFQWRCHVHAIKESNQLLYSDEASGIMQGCFERGGAGFDSVGRSKS